MAGPALRDVRQDLVLIITARRVQSVQVRFEGATFRYRVKEPPVLQSFDLVIPRGRTILLGPNGAGKSTVLAVAASVLPLHQGHVTIDGLAPLGRRGRAAYRRRVAWVPQRVTTASGLSVREQIALHGWLAGMSRRDAWSASKIAVSSVDLAVLANRPAANLSGGQRARMGIAQALVHDADVLLFDEPAAALDPDQKEAFSRLLERVARDRTVVVSTHDVADLEQSYDRVVVLDGGQLKFDGSTGDFLRPSGAAQTAVEAYRAAVAG